MMSTHVIRIGENHNFKIPTQFCQAIRHFVNGLRNGNAAVIKKPQILFGNVLLRLDGGVYKVQLMGDQTDDADRPQSDRVLELVRGNDKVSVEEGLLGFASTPGAKRLRIVLPAEEAGEISEFVLNKTKTGEYHCHVLRIQSADQEDLDLVQVT